MKNIFTNLLLVFSLSAFAQTGIGTTSPNASAQLEVASTTKGFLPPRMTASQRSLITLPAKGLLVYQIDATAGYYFYTGAAWVKQGGANSITDLSDGKTSSSSLFLGSGTGNNSTGSGNVAVGQNALVMNTTGINNTAIGGSALFNNTANYNTAIGYQSLWNNTSGTNNVAQGTQSLATNITGSNNVALGQSSLFKSTSSYNTSVGSYALYNNTSGFINTALGYRALYNNVTGNGNVAVGYEALISNLANDNTAVGMFALNANTSGASNTAVGKFALVNSTTASNNTAIGVNAGSYLTNGSTANKTSNNSVYLGVGTKASADGNTNEIVIGYNTVGNGSNTVTVGNNSIINAVCKVAWTTTSDARDKNNFAPLDRGLEFINKLKPYSFEFRKNRDTKETDGIKRFGFKAQDIEVLENGNFVIVDNKDAEHLKIKETYIIPVLVKAVQELQKENEELKETLQNQNTAINELRAIVEELIKK
jgi:hypothetical protein